MVKTAQFQRLSHPGYRWLAPPVATVPKNFILERSNDLQRSNDVEILTKTIL
jgi:hypothetical protein